MSVGFASRALMNQHGISEESDTMELRGSNKRVLCADAHSHADHDEWSWHPGWKASVAQGEMPPAKRHRLMQMSQLYESLHGAVFAAMEARARRDDQERATSLEIALKFPLVPVDPRTASPTATPESVSDRVNISPSPSTRTEGAKHTPCLSPSKSHQNLPLLQLNDVELTRAKVTNLRVEPNGTEDASPLLSTV